MTRRGYDVSPPTDDRPFFFQTLNILSGTSHAAEVGTEREQSVTLLRSLVGILGGLVFVLVLLPVAARGALPRGPTSPGARCSSRAWGSASCSSRFRCCSGSRCTSDIRATRPPWSWVAAGRRRAGAGSPGKSGIRRRLVALLVPLVVGASFPFSCGSSARPGPIVRRARRDFGHGADVAGAMMGMPFPLGMANFDDRDRSWYWAVNGATSVLASVLALVIALIAGFSAVLGFAVAAYCWPR